MITLDERPCNYDYPGMMPKTEYELVLPPKDIMGRKKQPGNTDEIARWLMENAENADAMVVSLDTLVYGGILPSRLHLCEKEELVSRADILKKLKEINPSMKLYVFGLIMRCPSYSSDDEEPDYYENFGAEIHLYGKYTHMEKLDKLTEEDKKYFRRVKEIVN